jgi:hypothetical protein
MVGVQQLQTGHQMAQSRMFTAADAHVGNRLHASAMSAVQHLLLPSLPPHISGSSHCNPHLLVLQSGYLAATLAVNMCSALAVAHLPSTPHLAAPPLGAAGRIHHSHTGWGWHLPTASSRHEDVRGSTLNSRAPAKLLYVNNIRNCYGASQSRHRGVVLLLHLQLKHACKLAQLAAAISLRTESH